MIGVSLSNVESSPGEVKAVKLNMIGSPRFMLTSNPLHKGAVPSDRTSGLVAGKIFSTLNWLTSEDPPFIPLARRVRATKKANAAKVAAATRDSHQPRVAPSASWI